MARRGYLQQAQQHRRTLRRLCGWGLSMGFLLQGANLVVNNLINQQVINRSMVLGLAQGIISYSTPLLLALGYVCGLTLLCLSARWLRLLNVLAPAGRMTLTNYVMQSVLGWVVFHGSGMGLYLRVGPVLSLMIALVLCTFQVLYSTWWLIHFRMGPLEWAWRWAIQGKRPALRRETPKEVAAN
jgi:uncharacterized protein